MWPFSKREPRPDTPLPPPNPSPTRTPVAFITYRTDPIRNPDHDPQTFGRYPVAVREDMAPAPVAYSQFSHVGRDPAHAFPFQWQYQFVSFRDWLGVAHWPFTDVGHTEAGSLVYMPQGRFNPGNAGRGSIKPLPQTSLGAQSAVQPNLTVDINHLKLVR
jgi:hypothetical protein